MSILPHVIDKVKLFENEKEIILTLVDPNIQNVSDRIKGILIEMFLSIDDTSSDIKKEWLTDALRHIVYYEDVPSIYKANAGEDIDIKLCLSEGEDWSNYAITARRADDNTILSPKDTIGDSYTNEPEQYVHLKDINLSEDEIFKVHILLEEIDNSNEATGNAVTHITDVYLFIDEQIDSI